MNTYKAAEFAKLAAVSVKTLQRWDREGQLKPVSRTSGNRRLYIQEQLNTLLNRQTHDCQLIVLNTESLSPEQEMAQDLMTITNCFSA